MCEYNFWDDRTTEVNESNYCPILDDYCLEWDCDQCESGKLFNEGFISEVDEHENSF